MTKIKKYLCRDIMSCIPISTVSITGNDAEATVPLCNNCTYLECKDTDAMNDTYYCCILDNIYRYSEDAPKEPCDCKNYCTGEIL